MFPGGGGRNRIITRAAQRIASENPPQRQSRPLPETMNFQRLQSVFRTRRREPAARRYPRGNANTIQPNEHQHGGYRNRKSFYRLSGRTSAFLSTELNSFRTSGHFSFKISRRGIKTIPQGEITPSVRRSASRRRRRARFLRTARLSNFLLHMIPHFTSSRNEFLEIRATKRRVVKRLPSVFTASNSDFNRRWAIGGSSPSVAPQDVLSTLLKTLRSECKSLTAFLTAAADNRTASARCHSGTESAFAKSLDFGRLIRSFHFSLPFLKFVYYFKFIFKDCHGP